MIFCFFPNWHALESQRPGLEVFFVFLYLVNISAKAFCWKTVTRMIWMIWMMWLYIVIYPSGASSLWGISMFSLDHARSLSLRLPDNNRGMLQPHCYMGDCQGLSNNGLHPPNCKFHSGTMMIDHVIWGQPIFQLSRPAKHWDLRKARCFFLRIISHFCIYAHVSSKFGEHIPSGYD